MLNNDSIRSNKLLSKIIIYFAGLLLRFYSEIVSGIWVVFAFIPFEEFLSKIIFHESTYNISWGYAIFFTLYTILFLIISILIPYIKEWFVILEIEKLFKKSYLTDRQHIKIKHVIKNVLIYKSLFTLEGFLQFTMTTLYSTGIIFAYFGIESLVSNIMLNKSLIISFIFLSLFIITLIIENVLDNYLSVIVRNRNSAHNHFVLNSKNILTLLIKNLGLGGSNSLSEDLGQIVLEDAVEDIFEILEISNSKVYALDKRTIKRIKLSKEKNKINIKTVKQPHGKKEIVVKRSSKRSRKKSK